MTSQDTPHNKRPKPSESIQKDVDVKVDKYIAEITASWQKAVSSILETGRLLIQAKAELPHGKFGTMIEEKLPFGARTAQMLMVIAGHPVLSNAKCISHLPPHWATLHELAQLPEPRLLALIEDGTVHPELEHAEAAALRNEGKSKEQAEEAMGRG